MTKIRFDRLKRVADYLARKKPSPSFSMSGWELPGIAKSNHCGFAGCAIGWVAHRKMFRGFRLQENALVFYVVPAYQGAVNYEAVEKLFGISYSATVALFGPSEATPQQVAHRIRSFTAHMKKVAA